MFKTKTTSTLTQAHLHHKYTQQPHLFYSDAVQPEKNNKVYAELPCRFKMAPKKQINPEIFFKGISLTQLSKAAKAGQPSKSHSLASTIKGVDCKLKEDLAHKLIGQGQKFTQEIIDLFNSSKSSYDVAVALGQELLLDQCQDALLVELQCAGEEGLYTD